MEKTRTYTDYSPKVVKEIIKGKDNLEKARLLVENIVAAHKGGGFLSTADLNKLTESLTWADRNEVNKYLELSDKISKQRYNWALINSNLKIYSERLYAFCNMWQLAEYDVLEYNTILKMFRSPKAYRVNLEKVSEEVLRRNLANIKMKYDPFLMEIDEAQDGTVSINIDSINRRLDDMGLDILKYVLSQAKAVLFLMDEYTKKYPEVKYLIPSDIEQILHRFAEDLAHTPKYSRRVWLSLKAEKKYSEAKKMEKYAIFPDFSEVEADEDTITLGKEFFGL